MKFKVQTLDQQKLAQAAQDLARQAQNDFAPNLYIGIRTGGYDVAKLMSVPEGVKILPITCRRPGTDKKSKSSLMRTTLKNLPYFISNKLRVVEHIYLTQLKKPTAKIGYEPDPQEFETLKSTLNELGADAKIFIIDDSLDSGATMLAVLECVKQNADQSSIIKTGVITQTTKNPLIIPDFKLYDLTLCRFPWSFDFKERA